MKLFLESLLYIPDPDWYGIDVLTIHVNDLGNIGEDGEKDDLRKILIDVTHVQDTPIIYIPSEDLLIAIEDTTAIIGSDCYQWTTLDSSHKDRIGGSKLLPVEHNINSSASMNLTQMSFSIKNRNSRQNAQRDRFIIRRSDKLQGSRLV